MKQRPTIECQVIFRLPLGPDSTAAVLSGMEAEATGQEPLPNEEHGAEILTSSTKLA